MIFNAIKEKYPEMIVVGTVGPFNEGTDYVEGWKLADNWVCRWWTNIIIRLRDGS